MNKIFDAHCDTVYELLCTGQHLCKNSLQLDIERMEKYDTYIQVFAAFIDKKNINTTPMKHCLELIEKYHCEIEKNKDRILPILTAADIKKAEEGGVYSVLSIEGGEALGGDISAIRMYYDAGVRLITLTWNYANEIADGITESRGGGLTDFGREAVRAMEDIGILIDVSHLSERGFWDVAECTKYPFAASHSCAKRLCAHPRNLSDEQIAEIIERNGFVGVNFYPLFLTESEECGIEDIIRHIGYIIGLGGEDIVGLGSDFDGVDCLPGNMHGAEDMKKLLSGLSGYGLTERQTDKILYGNLYRVFYDVLSRSAKSC